MNHFVRVRAAALIVENNSILLVEFEDENGLHYNLPAGGLEPGESLIDAVKREAREETSVEVEVGSVAFVYEYEPIRNDFVYGNAPSIGVTFACKRVSGSLPRMPEKPDSHQVGVRWVPLTELKSVQLYPEISDDILAYVQQWPNYRNYVEESDIQQAK